MTDLLARLSAALGWLLRALIRVYQLCLSSVLPPSCRFTPTCSDYACQAIVKHGPLAGVGLAVWRILRCNPWNAGGDDPVPARLPFGLDRDRKAGCRHGAAPHDLMDQR